MRSSHIVKTGLECTVVSCCHATTNNCSPTRELKLKVYSCTEFTRVYNCTVGYVALQYYINYDLCSNVLSQ